MMQTLKTNVPGFAVDYFGNDIKVGDMIVYPNRSGSSMWMNHGTVMAVGMRPDDYSTDMKPVLQVRKVTSNYDNSITGHRMVEIVCLDRVIALGRVEVFKPKKDKPKFRETWLDRVMRWIRRDPAELY